MKGIQAELQFVMPQQIAIQLGKLPDIKQWFRIPEAATIFGVSNQTIRNWIDEGSLEGRKIASPLRNTDRKHCRVTRESIIKLLNDTSRRTV